MRRTGGRLVAIVVGVMFFGGCGNHSCPPCGVPRPAFLAEAIAIETIGDAATPLLAAGIRLPASTLETFSSGEDGQATFQIKLLIGDAPRASANRSLLNISVPLRPGQPRGAPQIDVMVAVDAQGKVTIDAGERGEAGRFHRDDLQVAVDHR